jgi:hypothetical protein
MKHDLQFYQKKTGIKDKNTFRELIAPVNLRNNLYAKSGANTIGTNSISLTKKMGSLAGRQTYRFEK